MALDWYAEGRGGNRCVACRRSFHHEDNCPVQVAEVRGRQIDVLRRHLSRQGYDHEQIDVILEGVERRYAVAG